MKPVHAALAGSLTGMLLALAVCLIRNIPLVDALFRVMILAFACAWMGVLLAWLNLMLPTRDEKNPKQQDSGA